MKPSCVHATKRRPNWWTAVLAMLYASQSLSGCGGCESKSPASLDPALLLLPAQTQSIVSIDVQKIRSSVFWKAMSSAGQRNPDDLKILHAVHLRTGFDPLTDIHRLVFAFPDDARTKGEFGLVAYGKNMDERRLVSYARDEASSRGLRISQHEHSGRRLWAGSDKRTARAGFFLNAETFALGGGGWAEEMVALVNATGSGAPAAELSQLCRRIGTGHAAWAAAVVSGATRTRLAADSRYAAAAAVAHVAVTVDLHDGFAASAFADLSTKEAAIALAAELDNYVRQAKQSPKLLLMGLGPWLNGIATRVRGPQVNVTVKLDASQTQSVADQLSALIQMARNKSRQ